jgi:hypothetical protein
LWIWHSSRKNICKYSKFYPVDLYELIEQITKTEHPFTILTHLTGCKSGQDFLRKFSCLKTAGQAQAAQPICRAAPL